MATLKTMLMNQLAKEDEYEKAAAARGSTSTSSTVSESSTQPEEDKSDDSLLANRPKLTWTLGEAQDFLGMEEINEENIRAKFLEIEKTGDESAKSALKTLFMAEHLTERYEDDLLSLNQNMASILSSGGFDSVDEAANYVFRNDDGSSRYRFLSDDEQPELVRPVEYDLAAMEEAFRIKYAETLDTRNAASDPDAASRMVDLQKNAVVASEGSLLQGGVLPTNYLRKKSLYDLDSAGILADGVLWAGTAKPKKGVGVVASAAGAPVKPINEQISDYYGEKISENQQGYLDNLKEATGLVGKYADWTDDQKFAAQNYISDARGGHDLSDALIELHAAGLSDEEIHAFQTEMSEALNSADFTEEAMDSWFEPAPEPEPTPEPAPAPEPEAEPVAEMSVVDNRSDDMIFGNHIVVMEQIHDDINNGRFDEAAEKQYGLLVDMVARSDDKYVQDLVHSEGSQKAAMALMLMVQNSGLPNQLDDSDIRAQLRVYEGYIGEALGLSEEAGALHRLIDWAFNGAATQTQDNEGIGLWSTLKHAASMGTAKFSDLFYNVTGTVISTYGTMVEGTNWLLNKAGVKTSNYYSDKIKQAGTDVAGILDPYVGRTDTYLREHATTAEYLGAMFGGEAIKEGFTGTVARVLGTAAKGAQAAGKIIGGGFERSLATAMDAVKLEQAVKMLTMAPFAAESGAAEFQQTMQETGGNTVTALLSSLITSGVTMATSDVGIVKNIQQKGLGVLPDVVDALSAVPGAGTASAMARGGKAMLLYLGNLLKSGLDEGFQEVFENLLGTAATDPLKGDNFADRFKDGEYAAELTSDAIMGFVGSLTSSIGIAPEYSKSWQVANANAQKSALTKSDVAAQINAFIEDVNDPMVLQEMTRQAQEAAVEFRTDELIASGAVDSSKATKADELRNEAQKHFVSAQREEQRTKALMQQANERMKANGNDKESTKATLEAIEAHKNAGLTLRDAEEKLAKANQTYEEESAAVRAEAQAMAKQEIGEQLLARQQERQQREVAREQQRQDANADVLYVDDFIATDLAAEGWEPTDEERQKVSRLMQERRNARAAELSQNTEAVQTPDVNHRFVRGVEKKFGVKVTVMDTSKGGTVLRYNGAYDPRTDSIVIDSKATQSDLIYGTLLHELTHKAEKSQTYKEFASAILRLKYGQDDTRLAADIRAKQESYNRGLAAMAKLDESVDATPLTADQASREIVADLTREILYGDEASINQLVAEQPSVARRMLDTIKNFIRKLAGTNDPALDQLNRTRELFEKALGEAGQDSGDVNPQYQIRYEDDGTPVVEIDEDILAGVKEKDWPKMARQELKNRFPNGVTVGARNIEITRASRGEFTNSKYSTWLRSTDADRYADKLRSAANMDEVLLASRNYVNEEPEHERTDNVQDFARGKVKMSLGGREYEADVLVAGTSDNTMKLYDILEMNQVNGKETGQPFEAETSPDRKTDLSAPIISNSGSSVNPIITESGEEVADIIRDGVTKSYSLASWTPEEKRTVRDTLLEKGYEPEAVEKWIDDVDGVAAMVANDKARLDFTADPDQVMLKNNQEYVKTLDASTLCAKRLLYQGTFNEIQHLLPNTPLTSDQLLDLLNMMKDAGYESPCGVCYVESRRRHLGKYAQEWLEGYNGEYKPTLDEVTTTDGLAKLKKEHPEAHDAFIAAMKAKGSANPKVVELRTDYRGDIRKISERDAEKIRRIGGLRVQSFSDFETPHMLDMMQAVLDMTSKGLTSQAYTKVPNFAWVFGDTGIKINLSLLAEGNGLDADGNLIFSSTEGMDIDEALRLRERYSDNVGTIIVGANDDHIRAAMADPRIDYIIPFHRSGWGQNELKKVGVLQTYTDYQASQNERTITGYKKNGKPEYGKPEGGNFYPIDYWDYSKTGDENAATYLRMCEEDGRVPKFDQFLEKDADGHWVAPSGYWKMLIDFKMYNNDGVGVPQQAVQPNFNMEEAHRVLDEYEGGADELPVAQDIVERFVSEYKAANPRTQYSLPSDMVLVEMIDRYLARQEQGGIAPPANAVGNMDNRPQPRMGERQYATQNVQNSVLPEWLKAEFMNDPQKRYYEKQTNYEQMERGYQKIMENGFTQERDRLLALERMSADDVSEANLMIAIANREGDAETLLALAAKSNSESTKAAQELQAFSELKRMSPTGAKAMVAGQLENRLQDELETHRPKQRRMNERAQRVAERLAGLPAPEETSSDNRWGVELNNQQMELIRHYGLERTTRPGIYYNRATIDQRMLEAIIATPNPLAATGNGLNLVQRLEYMDHRMAVVTNADLSYIGAQLGQFIGFGGEMGNRDAEVAVARAHEAFGNITPVGRRQKMRTWRYMSMLGTLTSPERNIIGNIAQSVPNAAAHGLAANVVDPIVSLLTGQRTTASLDVRERVEGWRAFVQETKDTFKDFFVDRVEVQNRLDDKFNTNRNGRVYQSPVLEAARNVESFLMSVGDRNFWKKAYVNSIAEQQKLLDRGLLRNEDGTTPTQEQILERAEADANYATFNEDNRVRDAVTALKQVPGLGDAMDFIMPFTGVPTNIISRMWQYSPMGLASTVLTHAYRGMSGQNFDQRAFVDGISRGITGTALFGVGMLLQAAGTIRLGTGDEEDDKTYGIRTAQGEQYTPFIYNPFKDEYVSLSTFAPAISPLIMGATAQDLFKNEEDKAVALQNAAFASLDQIFDASYMTGLSDIFNGYGSATENIATSLFSSAVSQNVPALLGQISSAMDPYVRDTKDKNLIMEALKSGLISKIPGLRETLPKKIDVTGQPVMQGKEGIENFFNPFTVTDARDDEVLNELMRLSGVVGNSSMLPSDALSGRKNSLTISGVDFTVDGEGKEAYKQRYGELWYNGGTYVDGNGNSVKVQGVADLIESSAYAKMTDTEKSKAIEKTIELASRAAKAEAAVAAGEDPSKVWDKAAETQRSVLKSNAQIQVEAGRYSALSTYVADMQKAGSNASAIKRSVTELMKPIYQELNRKGDTEAMKDIRRILYQTGLYDKYNFEKNWLK